ncbi:hypothetical protein IG197_01905 [Aminobacter sp. SR38]|jgi:hypothetical protein|uniref:hypothetical protein n=1 Tax=Aminobacter sp. SR38 TaxID=2774562 RepID=UPI00178538F4|nr:hypothetical protein [Aminobacter sp. SR38]QOF71872.1 hypothetical protein IG197_01905 [Aminobacter sp. SR38]
MNDGYSRSKPMVSSYLAFVASRMEFNEFIRPEDWKLTDPAGQFAVVDGNTVVRSVYAEKATDRSLLLGADPEPEWLHMVEVVEIGRHHAAPDFEFYDNRHEDEFDEAAALVGNVDLDALERPTFGRRLLLVWTCGEEHEVRRIESAKDSLKRALGPTARSVWHGNSFMAVAFCDARKPNDIALGLERHFDGEFVWDWLIVELLGLPVPDRSGLSPLATWIETAGRAAARRGR